MPRGVYERTEQHCTHLSESLIGRKKSEKHAAAIAKACTGVIFSQERRNNISSGLKGRHCSKEARKNMSESHKGIIRSTATRVKMCEAATKRMERQLLNGTTRFMDTDIEMLMYEGLLSRGYIIEKQKQIKNIVRVDFYLPEHNIIIEADSEHWHNLPGRQERDKIRTEKMQVLGYKVLRFWGNDIKHNLQNCLNKIEVKRA